MGYRMLQVLVSLLGPLLLTTTLSARTMYATDTFEIVVRSAKQITATEYCQGAIFWCAHRGAGDGRHLGCGAS